MDGAAVDVDASLRLIKQTSGNRQDVADRNAYGRGNDQPLAGDNMEKARRVRAVSDARSAAAKADKEEMERDQMAGNLLAREDVDAAFKFLGAAFRAQMDVFPDQVAPVVAPVTSLEEVHAMLTDHCRNVLAQLGEAIQKRRAELQRGGN